jgi:hypothetical protein
MGNTLSNVTGLGYSTTAVVYEVVPTAHFRFIDLPIELQIMVYGELVVVGKVFYTPGEHDLKNGMRCKDYKRFDKPDLSILRVCKQIHEEAESIYLGTNLFVLPCRFYQPQPFSGGPDRALFSKAGLNFVKNISISIDKADPVLQCVGAYWNEYYEFDELDRDARASIVHDAVMGKVDDEQEYLNTAMHFFNDQERLNYVEIDYSNAYCPLGYCRVVSEWTNEWIQKLRPKALDIIGLRPGEEADFRSELGQVLWCTKLFGLRFRQPRETTKWDKWMTLPSPIKA